MNGTPPAQIQIIAPFTAALDWMKMVLFAPFDFVKWLTIAFAAFLAGHWGSSFRFGRSWNIPNFNYSFRKDGNLPDWDFTPWFFGVGALVVLLACAVGIVWMWVSSRGRFMFTDCVVRNRAAIAEPWHEFRREGNSYFLFSLVLFICGVLIFAVFGLLMWLLFLGGRDGDFAWSAPLVVCLILFGLVWLVLSLFFALVFQFMVPVMYRRRCSAKDAFVDVTKLIFANPGPFLLFVLFSIALLIAVSVVGTLIACVTCCIGGLPYISTVILLPAIVWLAAYKLLFIRQFGDAYDVWATIAQPAAVAAAEPLPPPAT
jgi:hypothetical protein